MSRIAVLLCLVLIGCGGLDPNEVPAYSGIRGKISYVGGAAAWPADSVYDIRVVAFETKPVEPAEVLASIVGQTAAFSPESLPKRVDTSSYTVEVLAAPRTFTYVVVALQNGPDFLTDWVMLDVYAPGGDRTTPGTVRVEKGSIVTIDFTVDFNNLPPQPFR